MVLEFAQPLTEIHIRKKKKKKVSGEQSAVGV
jgi:hypothetical protein